MDELSHKFRAISEKRMWKAKLEANLAALEEKLAVANRQLVGLERVLSKEERDLQQLEGLSLRALFATILGSKDEQTQKERQEFLQAQLQTHAVERQISAMMDDRASLVQQLSAHKNVEDEYQALLLQKEGLLKAEDANVSQALFSIDENQARTVTLKKEVTEAIEAATAALGGLENVISSLESARSWGNWDIVGGGLLATAVKHDHMDQARQASEQVQAQINTLLRELKDVSQYRPVSFDIAPLEYFGDLMLDGILFDWLVQSKILRSLEQTRAVKTHITDLKSALVRQNRDLSDDLRQFEDERQSLIEQG